MNLTYDDLHNLSDDQIAGRAKYILGKFKKLPENFTLSNDLTSELESLVIVGEPPATWPQPISEKIFDKFLELVKDPAKLIAFILILQQLLAPRD